MSDLAGRLRQLRGADSQVDLAGWLGVSTALVSAWERGKAITPAVRLEQYAQLYGPGNGLLAELMLLREQAGAPRPQPTHSSSPLLDVLKDIRHLLVEIRDRLPPKD